VLVTVLLVKYNNRDCVVYSNTMSWCL